MLSFTRIAPRVIPRRPPINFTPLQIRHPFRLVILTLKWVAFAHLFWEYGYCMAPASGPSMLPTFEVLGEWLIVDKTHRLGRRLSVGDMVSYNIPTNTEQGVKRVIGLPGDYVLMGTPGVGPGNMIQVPEGHCWLVGDNIPASRDSRQLGPIPLALVRGKVVASYRPSDHAFRWFSNPLKDGIE
ncbi:hypothetical protein QBC38DRAFT_534781 [Podospora fimiseda]|uniref:Peptidase S26 domain-containing protein n=1 Tax=Podospora fimiseda TaxID=252190 RepID=A0AAN7BUE0_9PEZI|nr:hypothetical protein QBC38DRAFT_534781 [Podospora fimiseda]